MILNWRVVPERDESGNVSSVLSISRDITAHRKAERDYQILFREMLDGFALHEIILDSAGKPADYRFLAVNPAFERMVGLKAEEIVGRTVLEVLPGTEPYWVETFGKVALTGEPVHFENLSGEVDRHFAVSAFRPAPGQFACVFADITDRMRAEEERTRLQDQLSQAQRMESIGRLAGGVAHDFNNMLNVIMGHTEMLLGQLEPSSPLYHSLSEIQEASERSAALTRQLLAFARRQTVAPRQLDLNEAVESMLRMLGRLIGEDIELVWVPTPQPLPVCVDPSQIDQILTNLCLNARDAVGRKAGTITIETAPVEVTEETCMDHSDLAPGSYVTLTVSDDGCGMDRETRANVFEPFFTTKGVGQGVGLGLATVYGIVRQNDGTVTVYSEPGQGTTFRVYLPRHAAARTEVPACPPPATGTDGQATILLVEDEPALLRMTEIILEHLGYTVLAAARPMDAITIAREHSGSIDLLLTDVVMPEMNGRELARSLLSLYPDIHRVFMSGYTANVIAHQGVLDEGVNFIQKPFTTRELAAKLRTSLGR
jgi:PAS domain S-box-containing protein